MEGVIIYGWEKTCIGVEMWKDTDLVKPGMRHIGEKSWPSIDKSRCMLI